MLSQHKSLSKVPWKLTGCLAQRVLHNYGFGAGVALKYGPSELTWTTLFTSVNCTLARQINKLCLEQRPADSDQAPLLNNSKQ